MKKMKRAIALLMLLAMSFTLTAPALADTKPSFKDVSEDDYYYPAVEWAWLRDITKGTSPATFEPESVSATSRSNFTVEASFAVAAIVRLRSVTAEAAEACANLVNAGVPVSCQTVLLAGVNDSAEALLDLFRALQRARVRPYYVFQCDPVAGVAHFRVPIKKAKRLAQECAERIGGLGLPRFVADIPGSSRKVPIESL